MLLTSEQNLKFQEASGSFEKSETSKISEILEHVTREDSLHLQWLYTLSYLEYSGAKRMMKFSNHHSLTNSFFLRHAHEEIRHAYFLEKQQNKLKSKMGIKLNQDSPKNSKKESARRFLGHKETIRFIPKLDLIICKILKILHPYQDLKKLAYFTTSYMIEIMATKLYQSYQQILRPQNSPVSVQSILTEEEEHLHQTRTQMENLIGLDQFKTLMKLLLPKVNQHFLEWEESIQNDLNLGDINEK